MKELIDFNGYEQNTRVYGGQSGFKLGINYEGSAYMIKFPARLKDRMMKNVEISYSNTPVSEYLGSHIYEAIGIPVHKTLLGIRDGKIVVACKDFKKPGDDFLHFSDIKVTNEPDSATENDFKTNGNGVDLESILEIIDKHPIMKQVHEAKERFWDMFVVDALIGNTDRNNRNWGLIRDLENNLSLAPVFDNGNCFCPKMSDRQMADAIDNYKRMQELAYIQRTCIFEKNDKKINPYHLIQKREYTDCNKAVLRVLPEINLKKINEIIDDTPGLSSVMREFCKNLMSVRYEEVLKPAYDKNLCLGVEKDIHNHQSKEMESRHSMERQT